MAVRIDHEGNEYPSQTSMCRHYSISPSGFLGRLKSGMTVEQALTVPPRTARRAWTDHLGGTYASFGEMAEAWGLSDSTLQHRLVKMGLPLEQALTMTHDDAMASKRGCVDHTGRKFPSKQAMCEKWGVTKAVFFGRISIGWSLEKALTTPVQDMPSNASRVCDHTGREFPSVSEMCRHWNMTRSTYNARIKAKWSVEDALTKPKTKIRVEPRACKDHTGRTFKSLNAMCRHWHTTKDTFKTRTEKLGWSVEDALTRDVVRTGIEVTDYRGRTFPSVRDMCHFYGFEPQDLQGTAASFGDFLAAVRRRYVKAARFGAAAVVKRLEFPYFLVEYEGTELVWTMEQLLDEYHRDSFWPIPDTKMRDRHLRVVAPMEFPRYLVEYDGQEQVWDYWKIIRYRKTTGYGLSQPKHDTEQEEGNGQGQDA